MKRELPDLNKFERVVFKRKNTLDRLLSFSLRLIPAREVALLLGTNRTGLKFLPPDKWDRGILYKFNGKGLNGVFLKYFGDLVAKSKGLSPVRLYRETPLGDKKETDGIISFVLRNHQDFYKKGIKILIIDTLPDVSHPDDLTADEETCSTTSILSYNGEQFKPLPDLKIDMAIVKQFKSKNFLSAYVPDFGAIVFNTVNDDLLQKNNHAFIHEHQLKKRLNRLISAIEMASIAHIGFARGRSAAHIIWRKEKRLRKTAVLLKNKEIELNAQKAYLKAVGAVNETQLNMTAVTITDGVYAFLDMAGSAILRKKIKNPLDYFFILNLCHQIAANNATRYACRIDNFIGDSVFLQNASPFDSQTVQFPMGPHERIMLVVLAVASIFNDIHLLKTGRHDMDRAGRVRKIMAEARADIHFRAGMEMGTALIGPLGSQERRIVTAIGKAVNTASRLESTGVPDGIHISEAVMVLLKEARITRQTKIARRCLGGTPHDLNNNSISREGCFFDCYRTRFGIRGDLIEQRQNVSYKEFSKNISYVIKCIPGA
ncbi:adenylate/guanylate cyclase domain-containing protein [Desulfobacula sp.]|uniref:adenylate/guanylate cyclase domain-containing protein n=1 Tax=Desulfobacula sp. TaxID=2593537 RepID=UPI0026342A51|nr:adenylate/guanylate cyclase domain-containing protein [Desulfobacula sp.]